MPKLILRVDLELGGEALQAGAEVEVDEANASRMLRKGLGEAVVSATKKKAAKKKAKTEADAE